MIFSSNHTSTPMPSRLTGYFYAKKWAYRYSFNGQERDDEIAGAGNIMTAEFWEYDTRLGRRWNLDPVEYPWQSGYSTFNNNPNYFNDPFGLEGEKPGEQRTTSEGCNEVFNGKSWQDDQSSLKEILVTAARPQSKILKFLGEMDDAIHNPNSTTSQIGQGIGRTITEFHPAVPIYNIGSRNGWWGNGNNFWDEQSNVIEASFDYITFIPGGNLLKQAKYLRLLGKYKNSVNLNSAASDIISKGFHFNVKLEDGVKVEIALTLTKAGDIILIPARSMDAANSAAHEAMEAVDVMLNNPSFRKKVSNISEGLINNIELKNSPERLQELQSIYNYFK